jgi:hypothetical protein
MHIMCPSSGGYCDSDQEIRDLQLTHTTRSKMAAGELLDRDLVEHQAEEYLQSIEDDVMEHVEVALPGASDDERQSMSWPLSSPCMRTMSVVQAGRCSPIH